MLVVCELTVSNIRLFSLASYVASKHFWEHASKFTGDGKRKIQLVVQLRDPNPLRLQNGTCNVLDVRTYTQAKMQRDFLQSAIKSRENNFLRAGFFVFAMSADEFVVIRGAGRSVLGHVDLKMTRAD